MARRRQEKEDKVSAFEAPEFDEEEFIRKEWVSFRSTIVVIGYALATALVTYLAWLYVFRATASPFIATAGLAIVLAYPLKWVLPQAGVDVSAYKGKEWFGTGAIYFFSWLAFIVFILNPPLQDDAEPLVIANVVPGHQEPGGTVVVVLNVTDNRALDEASLAFEVRGPGGAGPLATTTDLEHAPGSLWTWRHTFDDAETGSYEWTLSVADQAGNVAEAAGAFNVTRDAMRVSPASGTERSAADRVIVQLPDDLAYVRPNPEDPGLQRLTGRNAVWSVHFTTESDPGVRHHLKYDREEGYWYTTPKHDGWRVGENNLTFHAATHGTYLLPAEEGLLTDSESYRYIVAEDGLVGSEEVPEPRRMSGTILQTPLGLEPALLALALAGLVQRRFRKKE